MAKRKIDRRKRFPYNKYLDKTQPYVEYLKNWNALVKLITNKVKELAKHNKQFEISILEHDYKFTEKQMEMLELWLQEQIESHTRERGIAARLD